MARVHCSWSARAAIAIITHVRAHAVVVSSRDEGRVAEAVQSLRQQGIDCTGVTCHVGNKEHRDRLIDTAVQVFARMHA